MRRIRFTGHRAAVALGCVGALVGVGALAGCSGPLAQEPASPSPTADETTEDSQDDETAQPISARHPYEAGASPDWSIEFSNKPLAIAYDRQSGTAVIVADDAGDATLYAFEVTNSGRTFERWTYRIPDGEQVRHIDAALGKIYVSVGTDEPVDLLIFHAVSGAEELVWSRSNPLDRNAPDVVGIYDDGVGVLKLDRDSVVAAILDDDGQVEDSERIFFGADALSDFAPQDGLVALDDEGGQTRYVFFPELKEVTGNECASLVDGLVCLEIERDETVIVEYDRNGFPVRNTEVDEHSAALTYQTIAFNDDTTVREYSRALQETVGDSQAADDADEQGEDLANTDPDAQAGVKDVPHTGVVDRINLAERIPAIVHDGQWYAVDTWATGSDVLLDKRGAPFALSTDSIPVIINVLTGEQVNEEGTLGIIGSGNADNMFFEWDGAYLTYLRPQG
ncbi:MAG: hypothetical protein GX483_03965 [Actinomycetaceae bacterium]|nr:hypothetical protein [Actinomycetaceae bacterium]